MAHRPLPPHDPQRLPREPAAEREPAGGSRPAPLYDEIRAVTRGPIWSADRFRRISRLNRGVYSHLVNRPFYRFGGELVALDAVSHPKADGTPRDATGNQPIRTELAVTCEVRPPGYLEMSVDSDDYRLSSRNNAAALGLATRAAATRHMPRPPFAIASPVTRDDRNQRRSMLSGRAAGGWDLV